MRRDASKSRHTAHPDLALEHAALEKLHVHADLDRQVAVADAGGHVSDVDDEAVGIGEACERASGRR